MQSAIRFTGIFCTARKEGGATNTTQVSSIFCLPWGLTKIDVGHLAQIHLQRKHSGKCVRTKEKCLMKTICLGWHVCTNNSRLKVCSHIRGIREHHTFLERWTSAFCCRSTSTTAPCAFQLAIKRAVLPSCA